MTESEWLACSDPQAMLDSLRSSASDRKFRLFAAACYRHVPQLLTERNDKRVLDVVERFADGHVSTEQFRSWGWLRMGETRFMCLFRAVDAAISTAEFTGGMVAKMIAAGDPEKALAWESGFQAAWAQNATPSEAMAAADAAVPDGARWLQERNSARSNEGAYQAELLRCIFGPLPFRLVTFDPAWKTPTVIGLAETIYEERAFDKMPVLSDALEEAGCSNQEILEHCRGPAVHCPGCWVIDLLLKKL